MIRFHIWFLVLVLVGGPLAAGFFLGFDAFEKQAQSAAESTLRRDSARADLKVSRLGGERIRRATALAKKAGLPAELLPLAANTGNPLAARDKIKSALERAGLRANLVAVADVRGAILLRAKDAGDDFSTPAIQNALQGQPSAPIVAYKKQLYHLAVVPVLSGAQVVGAMVVGRKIGAAWLGRLVGARTGVAAFLRGKLLASNVAPRERGDLARQFGSLRPDRPRSIQLRDQGFLSMAAPIASEPSASIVYLRSRQTALAGFEEMRLLYLYCAGGAFLLALLWGILLQRSIGRTTKVLIARMNAAADTKDGAVSPQGLSAPLGRIATAANELLAKARARVAEAEAAASAVRAKAEPVVAPVAVVSRPPVSEPVAAPVAVPPPGEPVAPPVPPLGGVAPGAEEHPDIEDEEPLTLREDDAVDEAPAPRKDGTFPGIAPPTADPHGTQPSVRTLPGMAAVRSEGERAAPPSGPPAPPSPPPPVSPPPAAAPSSSRTLFGMGAPPQVQPEPPRQPLDLKPAPGADTLRGVGTTAPIEATIEDDPLPEIPRSERTVIAEPPKELLRSTDPLEEQLPRLHEQFLAARRECSESTDEVTFDRFAKKVRKTRDNLRQEHQCERVDFEVYVRGGRAALRAIPRIKTGHPPPPVG